MLYDPKWERKTETKADPFKLRTLIEWLEQQPADETYCYSSNGRCLMAQYFTAHGFENVLVGGRDFSHGSPHQILPFSRAFSNIAIRHPRTFGGALLRAKRSQFLYRVKSLFGFANS